VSNDMPTPTWQSIEAFARTKIQHFIQSLLEEEVTALLGRARSERRTALDAPAGYRNGFGKERRLAMQGGTITLRRPRLRGLEERFESKILPLFARRTTAVGTLPPTILYLYLGSVTGSLARGAPHTRWQTAAYALGLLPACAAVWLIGRAVRDTLSRDI